MVERKKINNKTLVICLSLIIVLNFFTLAYFSQNSNYYEEENIYYSIDLDNLENTLNSYKDSINKTKQEIEQINSRTYYEHLDTNFKNVTEFLISDQTDKELFINETFDCQNFALRVNNNAEEQGIRCAYVTIRFNERGKHALIAFNTTDKGLVFFEPQNDKEVELKVGEDYWKDCIENGTYLGAGYIVEEEITITW